MRFGAVFLLPFLMGCATSSAVVPESWQSVPQAPRIRSLTLDENGKVAYPAVLAPRREVIRALDHMLLNGEKVITERFREIDSFDFSEARGEVVLSAKRDRAFDIGIVSSEGGAVNWVPADPADEVMVQWAPKGSKISYVIRANGGDVVRTVHVPTATPWSVPFPLATVHAVAWDPEGERFAVAYSTPDGSDRVEVMKYDGEDRRMAVDPAVTLDVEVEPFHRALLLRPRDIRYDEKLPVVVWVGDSAWNDARAKLIREARVAMIVTKDVNEELWKRMGETQWMSGERVFVVSPFSPPAGEKVAGGTTWILGGERYRRDGNVVTVPPAVIQSFAAGFIADQLKRTTPLNGSSR